MRPHDHRLSRRDLLKTGGAAAGAAALAAISPPASPQAAAARSQPVAPHISGPLYWEQLGRSGTPIAFVHPAPMDHSCYLYQTAHLSTWFRCVAMDLPGWGRSPAALPGLTADDLAQAVWSVMDEAVGSDPAIIVGISIGSTVALHMANLAPERTLAVVLSGAGYTPGPKEYAPRRIAQYREVGIELRYEHTFTDFSPEFNETEMSRWIATLLTERNPWGSVEGIAEVFRAVGEADPDGLYEGIHSPMLIITGSKDNAHATSFDLQAKVAGCELVTMEGAGHACNMERPWEWDAQFLAFLARHGLFSGESRWPLS
jgi:pimeloyl-ACP methyl ester carboxylesterase